MHDTNLEGWYDPAGDDGENYAHQDHRQVWQYNFDFPDNPFYQQGTQTDPIVYWLEVQAFVTTGEYFGWKTSISHWNDDAVYDDDGDWEELWYPGDYPFDGDSIDLAFVITTEPATLGLLVLGGMALLRRHRK